MVTEAIRRDAEEKEREAINDHDSDGGIQALAELEGSGIGIDDDEAYIESEFALEQWKIREVQRLLRDRNEQKQAEIE